MARVEMMRHEMTQAEQLTPQKMSWVLRGPLLVLAIVWVLFAALSPAARAAGEESFRQGIEATDLSQWSDAARHLQRATAEDGQESTRRVFISGSFSRPYTPHFHLGWALYKAGPEGCEAALVSWQTSEQQQVIQQFKRQYEDLQSAREACRRVLLPRARATVEAEIAQGLDLLRDLRVWQASGQLKASALADAEGALNQATEASNRARQELDLAAMQEALSLAEEARQQLQALLGQVAADSAQATQRASDTTRDAVNLAQQTERELLNLLADPAYAAARQRQPELAISRPLQQRLDDLRQDLQQAEGPDDLATVQGKANQATEELLALKTRIESAFAAAPLEPPLGPQPTPLEVATSDEPQRDELAGFARTETSSPTASDRSSSADHSASEGTPGLGPKALRMRDVVSVARQLLDLLQGTDGTESLMAAQRQRLGDLVQEAEGGSVEARGDAETDGLLSRLEASLGALQFLAGGEALLAGKPQRAAQIQALWPPPDDALAAHRYLFRAATHFALYQLEGERDAQQLQDAITDVVACRRLDDQLMPELRTFSPAFQTFFLSADLDGAKALP